METAIRTKPLTAATPRKRRCLRATLIVLAFLIGTPLGLYFYSKYQARTSWIAAEAEADRVDPDWRMGPLLLKRRAVPDEQNSALRIIAVAAKKKDFQVSRAAEYHN